MYWAFKLVTNKIIKYLTIFLKNTQL